MKPWKLRIREHSIPCEQQKSDYRERIKHRLREPEPSVSTTCWLPSQWRAAAHTRCNATWERSALMGKHVNVLGGRDSCGAFGTPWTSCASIDQRYHACQQRSGWSTAHWLLIRQHVAHGKANGICAVARQHRVSALQWVRHQYQHRCRTSDGTRAHEGLKNREREQKNEQK